MEFFNLLQLPYKKKKIENKVDREWRERERKTKGEKGKEGEIKPKKEKRIRR